MTPYYFPFSAQFGVNSTASVAAAIVHKHPIDFLHQGDIRGLVGLPFGKIIIGAPVDSYGFTYLLNRKLTFHFIGYKGVYRFQLGRLKMLKAFFKMSRSNSACLSCLRSSLTWSLDPSLPADCRCCRHWYNKASLMPSARATELTL